jgi:hypothetical protein
MNTSYKLTSLAGVLAAIAIAAVSAPAVAQQQAANCPKLSDVEWWTNTVPEVRRVVQASYNGSWDAYIDRWRQQQKDLQQAYNSGQSVEIKSRGLVFRNDDLKEYIGQVEERVKTLECLKREYAGDDQAALPKGAVPVDPRLVSEQGTSPRQGVQGEVKQELSAPQETKAIEGKELSLEVNAICEGTTPAFQITNLGDRWPRLAEISIFRTDTNGMVTQRRLRMTNSQQMVFKLPDTLGREGAEFGIFVQPTWYERVFQYDATIKCNNK